MAGIALIVLLSSGAIPLTESIEQIVSSVPEKKDEYETTVAYEARLRSLSVKLYAVSLPFLATYDADNQVFAIEPLARVATKTKKYGEYLGTTAMGATRRVTEQHEHTYYIAPTHPRALRAIRVPVALADARKARDDFEVVCTFRIASGRTPLKTEYVPYEKTISEPYDGWRITHTLRVEVVSVSVYRKSTATQVGTAVHDAKRAGPAVRGESKGAPRAPGATAVSGAHTSVAEAPAEPLTRDDAAERAACEQWVPKGQTGWRCECVDTRDGYVTSCEQL